MYTLIAVFIFCALSVFIVSIAFLLLSKPQLETTPSQQPPKAILKLPFAYTTTTTTTTTTIPPYKRISKDAIFKCPPDYVINNKYQCAHQCKPGYGVFMNDYCRASCKPGYVETGQFGVNCTNSSIPNDTYKKDLYEIPKPQQPTIACDGDLDGYQCFEPCKPGWVAEGSWCKLSSTGLTTTTNPPLTTTTPPPTTTTTTTTPPPTTTTTTTTTTKAPYKRISKDPIFICPPDYEINNKYQCAHKCKAGYGVFMNDYCRASCKPGYVETGQFGVNCTNSSIPNDTYKKDLYKIPEPQQPTIVCDGDLDGYQCFEPCKPGWNANGGWCE